MPNFMGELRALVQQSAKMLEVCILTCVRTTEVIQMQWSQLDLKRGRWIIPGKIMKNELQADIPLTATVLAILREIKEAAWDDKYVFPGLKSGTTCSQHHAEAPQDRHEAQRYGAWLPLDLPHMGPERNLARA